jgi:hypothetical protein
MARVCALAAVSACLPACAQITVITDNQPPKSEVRLGVLAVDLGPSTQNTVVSASGVGLISNPAGATLGYSKAKIIQIGHDCRVVIATEKLDAITSDPEMLDIIKKTPKACGA